MDNYLKEQPEQGLELVKAVGDRLRELTADYEEVLALIEKTPEDKADFLERLKKHVAYYKANKAWEAGSLDYHTFATMEDEGYKKNIAEYKKGVIICKEGEPGNSMYEIHGGSVGIYIGYNTPDEKMLTTQIPGTFFGEMGMLSKAPRSATAVVLEEGTTIEQIFMDDLQELLEKNPTKIYMLLSHLAGRIRALTPAYIEACKKASEISE